MNFLFTFVWKFSTIFCVRGFCILHDDDSVVVVAVGSDRLDGPGN